jgi:hypothetical protein
MVLLKALILTKKDIKELLGGRSLARAHFG